MRVQTHSIIIFVLIIVFYSPLALAADASLFSGGQIDTRGQGFSYVGLDITQKIYQNISIAGRLIPNYLTYKFPSGDESVRATSPGLYSVVGIKLSWSQTTVGLFGGTEYRYTSLHPDVKNADVRGTTFAGLIQGEFDTWLPSRTNFNVFGSFSGTSSFLYERARIKQQITNLSFKKPNTINIGVEQFFGRNPDFHQVGVGPIVELYNISHKIAFALRTGYQYDSTFRNGMYGGLDFYVRF